MHISLISLIILTGTNALNDLSNKVIRTPGSLTDFACSRQEKAAFFDFQILASVR